MPLAVGAGMIGSSVIGGLMAADANKDAAGQAAASRAQAQANIQKAVDQLQSLGIPAIQAQQILLQKPELVGQLTAVNLGPSASENIKANPNLMSAQMSALQGLSNQASVGLTPSDRLNLMNIHNNLSAENQANTKGILQGYAQHGELGGGQQLVAQLMGSQNNAQNAQMQGMQLAADTQRAKQNALSQYGNLAGTMSQADLAQQEQIARAKDIVSQFNAQNSQAVSAANLANRQNIANQGSNIANQQEQYNKGLVQQNYNNQLAKAQAVSNAYVGQASNLNAAAKQQLEAGQNQAQGINNMFSGISKGIGAAGLYAAKSPTKSNNNGGYNSADEEDADNDYNI